MKIIDILQKNSICSFQISQDFGLLGVSSNLSEIKKENLSLYDILNNMFNNDTFSNEKYIQSLASQILEKFEKQDTSLDQVVLSNDLEKDIAYAFSIGLDYVECETSFVYVRIANFKVMNTKTSIYDGILNDYESNFSVFEDRTHIGKFIIDFGVSKHNVYATNRFAELLQIPVTKDSIYLLTRHEGKFEGDNVLIRDLGFFRRTDMLVQGELDEMTDEWFYNSKWLKVDIKVLKRFPNGLAEYIGGVIYDISDLRQQEEFMYQHNIYEFAIESGQIGVFFYDVDKYGQGFFEANHIYAELIGLDRKENGYYASVDFEESLMGIEAEIQENTDVKERMNQLLRGDIEGTDNHILKIKHLKTNNIHYMLSSSRIEERYVNGEPKKIGGIIIDITDRIQREKHQIEFANKDELTGLSNNRKLMKDMTTRKPGIGLFFDLDNFKKFNDTYGHAVGDQILYEFSQALREASLQHKNVYVYRLYGDEFFVYAEGYDKDFALTYEEEMYEILKEKMTKNNYYLPLEASMGYALFESNSDIDDFIKEADYAMYKIKLKKKEN